MRPFHFFAVVLICLPSVGCVQFAALVDVDASGSGKVFLRYLVSEQFDDPSRSLIKFGTSQAEDAEDAEDDEQHASDSKPSLLDKIESRSDDMTVKLGEGVTFVRTQRISRGGGWRGVQAEYQFEDINKLTLPFGDALLHDDESVDTGSGDANSHTTVIGTADVAERRTFMSLVDRRTFRFRYRRGDTNELVIYHPNESTKEDETEEDPFEAAGLDVGDAPSVNVDIGSAIGATMAKVVLQGFRLTTMVKVDGEIIETNAVDQPKKNSATIFDLNMTKFVKDKSFDRAVAQKWNLERDAVRKRARVERFTDRPGNGHSVSMIRGASHAYAYLFPSYGFWRRSIVLT